MAGVSRVDLNCDMGESFGVYTLGNDADMLKIVTSANVACGFHAGDPVIMADTARTARDKGVAIGAHPAFFDLWGFGRRRIAGDSPADIEKMVKSAEWQKQLSDKGWADTYLAGDAFDTQLQEDIAATNAVLKDIGLVK